MNSQGVYRDKIKEGRADYFVEYQPADSRFPFATLNLVFLRGYADASSVARAMEQELQLWLQRFHVPLMLSALDIKDDLIPLPESCGEQPHLMGFRDAGTGEVVKRWGVFKDSELPSEQANADHLKKVYQGVPFRDPSEVRDAARRKNKKVITAARGIILFGAVVPFLITIISLGVTWLGYLVTAISIAIGAYKAVKALGWLKATEREKAKAEKERKMGHYYWHCERDPEAFNRLKLANFEREVAEATLKEAKSLGVETE